MGKYDDIINMEHPTSSRHPRMSSDERAAQFSPFAALTGHSAAIQETARLTDGEIELTEDEVSRLNEKLMTAEEYIGTDEVFTFVYFVPDEKKAGGSYREKSGSIKKVDRLNGVLYLTDSTPIRLDSMIEISGNEHLCYID